MDDERLLRSIDDFRTLTKIKEFWNDSMTRVARVIDGGIHIYNKKNKNKGLTFSSRFDIEGESNIHKLKWLPEDYGNSLAVIFSHGNISIWTEQLTGEVPKWSQSWRLDTNNIQILAASFSTNSKKKLTMCIVGEDLLLQLFGCKDSLDLSDWAMQCETALLPEVLDPSEPSIASDVALSWHPTLRLLAVGFCGYSPENCGLQVWRHSEKMEAWDKICELQDDGVGFLDVRCLAWAPNFKNAGVEHLATGSSCGLHIWDLDIMNPIFVKAVTHLDNHKSQVYQVTWNFDGSVLASVGDDNFVRLWALDSDGLWFEFGSDEF